MSLDLTKTWKVYKLEEAADNDSSEFNSIEFQTDLTRYELLSTQVFKQSGHLYLSVLWKIDH